MGTGPLFPLPPGPPDNISLDLIAQQEYDPANQGKLVAQGAKDSGWIERLAVAIWLALVKTIQTALSLMATILDSLLAALADFFLAAQAQDTPGFYRLTAALITDLTGIDVDGPSLFSQFQSRGRVAAMQAVGSQLVDALAGEMAGTYQPEVNGVFKGGKGDGIGGLPAVKLSPEQGVNAARAFMGFVMSFAVREGNTDIFASLLPYGIGEGFKSYAEDFSKSLGLGRLSRLALKPLFQNLVSIPMTWAFNKQYTPTLLAPAEVIRAINAQGMSEPDGVEELSRHGYSREKITTLSVLHAKWPSPRELFLEELVSGNPPTTADQFLSYLGHSPRAIETLRIAEQHDLSRRMAFELAHRTIPYVMNGALDLNGYSATLDALLLSGQEKKDLLDFVTELHSHPRKRLTFAQMTTAFVDGIVAVDEVANYLHEEGYKEDDIAILLQLDLFKLKAAQAKAAAKKAKTPKTAGG